MLRADKPHILILCSPNISRLEHVRKLGTLRNRYETTCCRIGAGTEWDGYFFDHEVEVPHEARPSPAAAAIESIDQIRAPDGIVNLSEAYVPLQAELCHHYGVLGPSAAAVRVGRNKLYMRQFCRHLGIPVPDFELATDGNLSGCARLAYPVVVKPAIGCSSTLVQRIDSPEEFRERFPKIRDTALRVYDKELLLDAAMREFGGFPFVVEELIGGSVQFPTRLPYPVGEISVESVAFGGRTVVLAIHDAPVASNGPYYEKIVNSTPTRIPSALVEKATDYVSRIHAALGPGAYVLHTEMRTFADDLVLLEFGVRIGGSSLYRSVLHSTSNDFMEILIELSLGRTPVLSGLAAKPTITHYFVPESPGRIQWIKGISKIPTSPYYIDHQVYDDVGDLVRRPPLRMRASGYFAVRGESFDELELETLRLLREIEIGTVAESSGRKIPSSRLRRNTARGAMSGA